MSLINKINKNNIPKHVAIIMDGNGRWAKARGKDRLSGHQAGANSVKTSLEVCGELGIKFLTVYAFSTENWNRPKTEVLGLMNLLVGTIDKELDEIKKKKVKVTVIGDMSRLDTLVQKKLKLAIEETKNNDLLNFIVALNYSGRWDIVNACKKLAQDCKENIIEPEKINENVFNSYLSTYNIPDPELLIRTSGEERISNFLLYQLAYSELYFTQTFWPDFSKEEFYKAILSYQNRERRFGKISEQLT
ncbi:MAG: isoprenyl transferase [Bacteroidota bacterium]|jgi:undecaprenyl diphosphate synthase|nr:isoprenyl transferase [Bacteroidales bacterium]MDI9534915.1 isoprenyl transferase [Bacteroidota bacterium]OQC46556.1 MAG: Ditrans,polycis-undecaprenyl-diphosphate synthase ((2E,6E)-farnesyl-diphosphate specific) [Bacteroidetes bacterium ADurb.Bin028]NLP21089.1 isoprenyl transferase [Bacteroidales bacterium]HNY43303.1 isoprenyl transferase [Bacteroidales bacterium]